MICNKEHRYSLEFDKLPVDQGGEGRHKCAGCAYERGRQDGKKMKEIINIDLNSLDESQAGTVRHKSPHAAYALGYLEGVKENYL